MKNRLLSMLGDEGYMFKFLLKSDEPTKPVIDVFVVGQDMSNGIEVYSIEPKYIIRAVYRWKTYEGCTELTCVADIMSAMKHRKVKPTSIDFKLLTSEYAIEGLTLMELYDVACYLVAGIPASIVTNTLLAIKNQ